MLRAGEILESLTCIMWSIFLIDFQNVIQIDFLIYFPCNSAEAHVQLQISLMMLEPPDSHWTFKIMWCHNILQLPKKSNPSDMHHAQKLWRVQSSGSSSLQLICPAVWSVVQELFSPAPTEHLAMFLLGLLPGRLQVVRVLPNQYYIHPSFSIIHGK